MEYLRNIMNGRVLPYSGALAKRHDMVPASEEEFRRYVNVLAKRIDIVRASREFEDLRQDDGAMDALEEKAYGPPPMAIKIPKAAEIINHKSNKDPNPTRARDPKPMPMSDVIETGEFHDIEQKDIS